MSKLASTTLLPHLLSLAGLPSPHMTPLYEFSPIFFQTSDNSPLTFFDVLFPYRFDWPAFDRSNYKNHVPSSLYTVVDLVDI
jgi:hypothetical protein